MANNKEEFSAEINLNTQNARNKIKELEKDLAHERQVLQVLTKDEQKHPLEIFRRFFIGKFFLGSLRSLSL